MTDGIKHAIGNSLSTGELVACLRFIQFYQPHMEEDEIEMVMDIYHDKNAELSKRRERKE